MLILSIGFILINLVCLFTCFDGGHVLNKDAQEGDDIYLPCRFEIDELRSQGFTKPAFTWIKRTRDNIKIVSLNDDFFEPSYKLDSSISDGKYDLTIRLANYERDNYQFECKIKQNGFTRELNPASYLVTILTPAGPPRITPSSPTAREGELFQLRCSSQGGSPDPEIRWTRDGQPLEAEMKWGERRDHPTESILTINPQIDDHIATYTCSVWNRAMREDQRLETRVTLNVQYAPRVEVGPYNPLLVMEGNDAHMTCSAKANPPVTSVEWYKDGKIISRQANHTIINVGPSDSGVYSCIASNGIKLASEDINNSGRLTLTVLFGPIVSLSDSVEAKLGESIKIGCNVNSEPRPYSIMWTKEDDPRVIQTGETLRLDDLTAYDSGRYYCSAKNKMRPSGSPVDIEKSGRSSVTIRVKHAPGEVSILPVNPVAVTGKPFTLTCSASPSGWPEPRYRWWKQDKEDEELGSSQNYTFLSVHSSHEGRYFCQPYNQHGKGSIATVYLTVKEAPYITIKMPPQHRSKQGVRGFSLTCKARGKPRPTIVWLHNGEEVNGEAGLYRVETKETLEENDVYHVQSILHFESVSRNELTAADRGKYECVFDNGIGQATRSETQLKIEHSPVLQHTYNKVAFDVGETAILECKMSAYPEPRFEWLFGSKPLDFGSRYFTNITEQVNDLFIGTLGIRDVRPSDYGDYTCRSWNSVAEDDKKTNIKLVMKSAPEAPKRVEVIEVASDSVTLRWIEGFKGGFADTEYHIAYTDDGHRWRNESCRIMNPCKIMGLESRHEYRFKVMAVNPRGKSPFSEEVRAVTKVNLADIPSPSDSFYDSKDHTLTFRVEPTALKLTARIEVYDGKSWTLLTTSKLRSEIETIRLSAPASGLSSYGDMRVILCLQTNESWCGYPQLIKTDVNSTYLREARPLSTEFLAVIISIVILAGIGVGAFCCCWKKRGTDKGKKDYDSETDSSRNKVPSISPPYYAGHDNKGLVNSTEDTSKMSPPPMYTSNNMSGNGHIPQNYYLTGDEAVPSPSGTNDETAQSDVWMMKSDPMSDIADGVLSYHHQGYGATQMDPNAFTYAYYPQPDEYQPLSNDAYNMNVKNSLYSPYYGDGLNAYGTSPRSNMMEDSLMDPQMLSQMDISKINHLSFDDEPDYGGNRSGGGSGGGKVIKEIIV